MKPSLAPFRRKLILCATGLALLGLAVSLIVVSTSHSRNTGQSTRVIPQLGVYAGAASPGAIKALGQTIGGQPEYAMDFLDGSTWQSIENPAWFLSQWQGSGYKMIWGVPILPNAY